MRKAAGLLIAISMFTSTVSAQTLHQRMDDLKQKNTARAAAQEEQLAESKVAKAARAPLRSVVIDNLTARNAVTFLSTLSGVPIVINWQRLTQDGIDPEQQVTLIGNTTVEQGLDMLSKQISPDDPLIWELTPWYVEVMSRAQANTRMVTMIYPINDLLHRVPNFDDAPSFDLVQITQGNSGSSGGGGGGGGAKSLFTDSKDKANAEPTPQERGQEIAATVRETVEPDMWKENGGQGSVVYFNGALIVRAPMYVQRKIGGRGGLGLGGLSGSGGDSTEEIAAKPRPGALVSGDTSATAGRYVTLTTGASTSAIVSLSPEVSGSLAPVTIVGQGTNRTGTAGANSAYSRGNRVAGISRPEYRWR
jgi:hypothetical protein